MNVLVINCGSSSVKFQLRTVDPAAPALESRWRAGGLVQGVGGEAELRFHAGNGGAEQRRAPVESYTAAVQAVLAWLRGAGLVREDGAAALDGVGHRVVHGGAYFQAPARIDAGVREALQAVEALAPLHNRPSLAGIEAVSAVLGERMPQVAVFDTAFHRTLPEAARTYALPPEMAGRHGIQRYGFHGTSVRSVLEQYWALTGRPPGSGRQIVLHLGSGCSATAVRDGQSADTSMGFTPLEGLVMGTRSGDLDPAVPTYLARHAGLSPEALDDLLNHRSGLLGVSGRSADLRDLLAAEAGDARAALAVELFCRRVRKYIGAYLAVLEGAEAVIFTGGVGEHLGAVRERVCAPLAWCGLQLDPDAADAAGSGPRCISPAAAPLKAYVIPSDEERLIAWDTARCLRGAP